jgi:hypothetical protein
MMNEYCLLHMFVELDGFIVHHARLVERCHDGGLCDRTAYIVVPSGDEDRLAARYGFTIVPP